MVNQKLMCTCRMESIIEHLLRLAIVASIIDTPVFANSCAMRSELPANIIPHGRTGMCKRGFKNPFPR